MWIWNRWLDESVFYIFLNLILNFNRVFLKIYSADQFGILSRCCILYIRLTVAWTKITFLCWSFHIFDVVKLSQNMDNFDTLTVSWDIKLIKIETN